MPRHMIYVYILCKNNIFVHFWFQTILDVKVINASLLPIDEWISLPEWKTKKVG